MWWGPGPAGVVTVGFDGKQPLTATRGPDYECLVRAHRPDGSSVAVSVSIGQETRDGRTLVAEGRLIEIEQRK